MRGISYDERFTLKLSCGWEDFEEEVIWKAKRHSRVNFETDQIINECFNLDKQKIILEVDLKSVE